MCIRDSYQFAHARLDGVGFLDLHRVSPDITGFLIPQRLFARLAYIYTDKSFAGRPERNSTVHAGEGELYWFFDGVRFYSIAGYRFEDEQAVGPEFQFTAHKARLFIIRQFEALDRRLRVRAGWRYENRDYAAITPSIGEIRDDERHQFQVELDVPWTDTITMGLEYGYDVFQSNLASVDFNQHVAALRFTAEF